MDEEPISKPLPRGSRLRNLAWGLAGFGLAAITSVSAGVCVSVLLNQLRIAGVLRSMPAFSVPAREPLIHASSEAAAEAFVAVWMLVLVFGPFVLSGVAAALRVRWWYAPVAGLFFGSALTGLASLPGHVPLEVLVLMPLWWLPGGLTGGALSMLRRRYRA